MKATRTWIVVATEAEAVPLAEALSLTKCGRLAWRNDAMRLIVTGMGSKRAAASLGEQFKPGLPERVIIAGVSGALCDTLTTGDVVSPDAIVDGNSLDEFAPTANHFATNADRTGGQAASRALDSDRGNKLLTHHSVVESPAKKRRLHERFECQLVDMESAAIARVCDEHRVPWQCIRVVLDEVSDSLPTDLTGLTKPDGQTDFKAGVFYAISRPWRIGMLMRLGRNTSCGMRAIAERIKATLEQDPEPPRRL